MRALFATVCLVLALGLPALGAAQDDAGAVRTRSRVIRPPEGSMRRGAIPVPGWVPYVGGGVILAAAAGALVYRIRKRRR